MGKHYKIGCPSGEHLDDGRCQCREKRVRIVGDHPHRGEPGTVRDDKPMVAGMWEIELDSHNLGARGCYAAPEHLRPLSKEEDPRA